MKIFQLVCLFVLVCWFDLFGQQYIGQDKINQLKNNGKNSYSVGENYKSAENKVYLEGIYQGYVSDVLISFDKLKYERGENVELTFSRTGSNSKVEEENIWIMANHKITTNGSIIEKNNHYYSFKLKSNEIKKLIIHLKDGNQEFDDIEVGIGRGGISRETRRYRIPYSLMQNGKLNKSNDSTKIFKQSIEDRMKPFKKKVSELIKFLKQ
jgi:hypothetical protein